MRFLLVILLIMMPIAIGYACYQLGCKDKQRAVRDSTQNLRGIFTAARGIAVSNDSDIPYWRRELSLALDIYDEDQRRAIDG